MTLGSPETGPRTAEAVPNSQEHLYRTVAKPTLSPTTQLQERQGPLSTLSTDKRQLLSPTSHLQLRNTYLWASVSLSLLHAALPGPPGSHGCQRNPKM